MALTCYPVPGKEKSKLICHAFTRGAPADAKGVVFYGTEGVMDAYQRAVAGKSGPWWYTDNAYFDRCRGTYFRVAKNALQVDVLRPDTSGPCDPFTGFMKPSTGERFARLGIPIRPWRDKPDGSILVCPQSDSFMKSTLGRTGNWTEATLAKLRSWGYGGDRVVVRPWERNKTVAYQTLREQLDSAAMVITWSSASAITALLEGIPAISESGAAHALTGPLTAENLLGWKRPSDEERLRFAEILADNQFTLDEFRDGTAWRWLERSAA